VDRTGDDIRSDIAQEELADVFRQRLLVINSLSNSGASEDPRHRSKAYYLSNTPIATAARTIWKVVSCQLPVVGWQKMRTSTMI
jgi:hypothetical protein